MTGWVRQLWAGVPAAFVRNLTPDEIAKIKEGALDNVEVRGHGPFCLGRVGGKVPVRPSLSL
jgi:hypothetical protein